MRMGDLLRQLASSGLSLAQVPDFADITVGGALATGSFSSSLLEPAAFHDQVVSVALADGVGLISVISGEALRAVKTNLGLLGVVVEATLNVVPLYKVAVGLETFRELDFYSGVVTDVLARFPRVDVHWYPQANLTVARVYQRVDRSEEGTCRNVEWEASPHVWRMLADSMETAQKAGDMESICLTAHKMASEAGTSLPFADAQGVCFSPVGYPHDMLLSSCRPGTCPWQSSFNLVRFAVAIPRRFFLSALKDLRSLFLKSGACFPYGGVGIRFLKRSDAYLSLSSDGDVVVFEIDSNRRADPAQPRLGLAALQEIEQLLKIRYQGRSHWGKAGTAMLSPVEFDYQSTYEKFLFTKVALDPHGIFDNTFANRVLYNSPSARPQSFPTCALENSCLCAHNSDCAPGLTCASGLITPEARVCRE